MRQTDVDRRRAAVLLAARQVVADVGPDASLAEVAKRAGVSRITVYNQFGSKARLLEALTAEAGPLASEALAAADPAEELRRRIEHACPAGAADPALYRQLIGRAGSQSEMSNRDRELAERLAADDRLRAGCSIKEAEDLIGILTSFPVFDRLHKGGRRSPAVVAKILLRMASVFMGERSAV